MDADDAELYEQPHGSEHEHNGEEKVARLHARSVPTWARVLTVRVSLRRQAGRCPYCEERHYPPLSYWYALYAYLAKW